MNQLPIIELRALLSAVSAHGNQHLVEAKADLTQTNLIMSEAIDKLSASFMKVNQLFGQQKALLEQMRVSGKVSDEHLKALSKIAQQVSLEVSQWSLVCSFRT